MSRKIRVPWKELRELAEALLDGGVKAEDVTDEIAAAADALVDWSDVLPAPAGALAEAADGPVARLVAGVVVRAVQRRRKAA